MWRRPCPVPTEKRVKRFIFTKLANGDVIRALTISIPFAFSNRCFINSCEFRNRGNASEVGPSSKGTSGFGAESRMRGGGSTYQT